MSHPIHIKARRIAHNIFRKATSARTHKRTIIKFVEKIGLVYFGSVSQDSDDHQVVRGFTVSSSHQDSHYSVGSINGYDIIVVERNDAVWQSDGSIAIQDWLIMAFNLHTKQDVPHFFLHANRQDSKAYETLFSTFPNMKEVYLGTFETYGPEFTSRFSLYSQPSVSIEVERLFPADSTRVLGAHFWPFSAELHNSTLYVYSDGKQITPHLLNTMLENGLWLANHLDLQAELV